MRRRSRRKPNGSSSTRPSNPTGAGYTRAELRALCDVLLRHPHVWIMSDDMYEHLVFDDFEFTTPAQIEPGALRPHPDLQRRVEILCDDRLAHRLCRRARWHLIKAMGTIQSQCTSNPCSVSQYAALEALTGPQDFLAPNRKLFQRRRDLVVSMLNAGQGHHLPETRRRVLRLSRHFGLHRQDQRRRARRSPMTRCSPPPCWKKPGLRWCSARPSGFRRTSASATLPSDEVLREACSRIQSFCAALT